MRETEGEEYVGHPDLIIICIEPKHHNMSVKKIK